MRRPDSAKNHGLGTCMCLFMEQSKTKQCQTNFMLSSTLMSIQIILKLLKSYTVGDVYFVPIKILLQTKTLW